MASTLELVTAARVSAAMLEDQLRRGHYTRAAATNRALQERIEAMAKKIEDLDVQLLAAMAAARAIPGPVKKPCGGRINPCAMMPGEANRPAAKKRPRKQRQTASDVAPMTSRRMRELDSPVTRIVTAYLAGDLEAGQELSVADLRDRFSIHDHEDLQFDLAFYKAPLRLVREGSGPLRVRAA